MGESRRAVRDAEQDSNRGLALFKALVYVGEEGELPGVEAMGALAPSQSAGIPAEAAQVSRSLPLQQVGRGAGGHNMSPAGVCCCGDLRGAAA